MSKKHLYFKHGPYLDSRWVDYEKTWCGLSIGEVDVEKYYDLCTCLDCLIALVEYLGERVE